MADLQVTNTFTPNTIISSNDVNTNFDDVVNYINNRNNGVANWAALAVTGNALIGGTLGVSGVASFANGSAGSPSISFVLDPDTGIYTNAGNVLFFVTGGTAHWAVTSAGDFGANGTERLLLADGTLASPAWQFGNDSDNGAYRIGGNNWALSAGGTKVMDFTATTVTVPVTLTLSSALATTSGGTGLTTKMMTVSTYVGNGATQDIAHGLGTTPQVVIISDTSTGNKIQEIWMTGMGANSKDFNGTNQTNGVTAVGATNVSLGANTAVNQNAVAYTMISFKGQ